MHVYTCLIACLHRDLRYPGTLLSLSALFPEGRVSLNMKFTVLVRLSSQLTPSMPLPRVLECGHPQFYMGAGFQIQDITHVQQHPYPLSCLKALHLNSDITFPLEKQKFCPYLV